MFLKNGDTGNKGRAAQFQEFGDNVVAGPYHPSLRDLIKASSVRRGSIPL